MLHTYQHHANISQKDTEDIFDYHKRYVESQRVVEESEFPALTDDIESIKFVESLNPRVYHEWQTLLINREHDAQAAGDDVSP
jgi:beta-galactosidase beta subunit